MPRAHPAPAPPPTLAITTPPPQVEAFGLYKLYGGAAGFLAAANVAEAREDHAFAALACARAIAEAIAHVRAPGEASAAAAVGR